MNDNAKPNDTNEQHQNETSSGGGIIAGSLETSLQVKEGHALFRVKNQTEQVKELAFKSVNEFEYEIRYGNGEVVFEKLLGKGSEVTLKQAEELVYEIDLPNELGEGTYVLTATLHAKSKLKAKTTFTIRE